MSNFATSITITYNPDLLLLERQINSLINQVDYIVIVDNSSTNVVKLKEFINIQQQEIRNKIIFICLDKNAGLGAAQNIGIEKAKTMESSHVLLLDQDSILPQNFIEQMKIAEAELDQSNEKYGAIGPVYFNEKTGEIYPITKYVGPFIQRLHPQTDPVEATFLIASGSFIKLEVLDKVGGMNEELFIDYVDVEWCFRAKSLGFKMFANPNVKMMHTIGDSRVSVFGRMISVHSPLRRYYLYRNSIYMIRNKSIDSGYKLREVAFNLFRLIVFLCLLMRKLSILNTA